MSRPSPDTWRIISPWLDEVLDLPSEARSAWLEGLKVREPAAAEALAGWLLELEVMDARAFLEDRAAQAPGCTRSSPGTLANARVPPA